MPSKFDTLLSEMIEEEKQGQETAVEEPAVETPAEEHVEEKPADEPKPDEEKPAVETPAEETKTRETVEKPDEDRKPIPGDKLERAEFSFRRQLAKQKEKHDRELADRDEKYSKLEKELAELRESLKTREQPKTRESFDNDEDYIEYKVQQKFAKEMEAVKAEDAKRQQELAEKERAARAEQEELVARQQQWLDHVDRAFEGDKDRAGTFIKRMQYCNSKGLGDVLDNCPVAADYLMNNSMGPLVFEKIVNDKDTMARVFNEQNLSPLDVYYELREIEKEIRAGQGQTAPAKAMPHIGKPGKQGGACTAPDIWSDDKALKAWMKSH